MVDSRESNYNRLFEAFPISLLSVGFDGRVFDCNYAFSALTGRSRQEITGKRVAQLGVLDQTGLSVVETLLLSVRQGTSVESTSLALEGKAGKGIQVEVFAIPFVSNGKTDGAILCLHDRVLSIKADRCQAVGRELQYERGFVRSLLDTANSIIICLDKDARIIVFNKECERVTGYRSDEVIGKNWCEMFVPEDCRHQGLDDFANWVREHPRDEYEAPINTKSGEMRTIFWSTSAVFRPDSEDLIAIAIGYDITDRLWTEKLQTVAYRIANAVSTAEDLEELFASIREDLGTVIDTTNFYIALYDKETDTISTPYQCDEKGSTTTFPAGKTMSSYVIKNNVPLLATKEVKQRLIEAGEIETIGPPSEVWLGVPLRTGNEVIGAVVVQDYRRASAYSEKDLDILEFVSGQIALAVERKRAEETVRTSEHRYALATEAAKVGVWDWNLETNEFYLDPRVKANLGYEDHEIPNDIEVWTNFVHPDDLTGVMKAAQDHLDGLTSEYVFEHRMLHKDGSVRWILVRGKAVCDSQGKAIRMVGTDTDITDRKLAEEKAERARFELNQIFEAATPMIVIDADYNMLRINDTFSALFQVSKDEVLGKKCYDVYPGPSCKQADCALNKILAGMDIHEYEDRTELRDGSVVTSIVMAVPYRGPDGTIMGMVESFTDITDRKKAEEALRLSEERFRELADLLPQTVFELDRYGKFIFANRRAAEMTGYTLKDVEEGLTVFQMFGPEERERIASRIPRVLQGEEFGGTEYSLIKKDGSSIPVMTYSSPIVRDGKTIGIRGIVVDITERKKAENELRKAYEKLSVEKTRQEEKNIALREVLNQIDRERKETKRQIQTNIDRVVMPILSSLKATCSPDIVAQLDLLQKGLQKATSPFLRTLETKVSRLTPREVQICNMIKEGCCSKEIASALNISPLTVNKFRQQIRRKLDISNKKINMASYLKSMDEE